MKRVIIESPYAGNIQRNLIYARAAMLDCLQRNEAPIVSHLLYTQVLNDGIDSERDLGMAAGHTWTEVADAVVVYTDLGISKGMEEGISRGEAFGMSIEFRSLEQAKK